MSDELAGKVVLISGAGRGIGEAIARRLHQHGASVVCGDIDETQVKAVASSLGERATAIALDVRSEESWQAAVTLSTLEFGTLDGLHPYSASSASRSPAHMPPRSSPSPG